jgi:hypothetical protein
MDQMAKLVSGRLQAHPAGPHPDADMLTAFAENALPDQDRVQLLQHLGTCVECREVLYLAAPEGSGVLQENKAPSFQPRSFPPTKQSRFLLRWATVGALAAILVGSFVANRQLSNARHGSAKLVAPPPGTSTYAKLDEQKIPEDVDKVRNAQVAQTPPRPSIADANSNVNVNVKERPEAKHMTARLQAPLNFGKSDQVRLSSGSASPSPNQSADANGLNLPLEGRNLSPLTAAPGVRSPVASQTKNRSLGGPLAPPSSALPNRALANKDDKSREGFAEVRGAQVGWLSSARGKGNLGGTIVDPSGAVIANARVTMEGPSGTEITSTRIASSNPDGTFSFDRLAAGSYSVKAEASGFRTTEITQVAALDDKVPSLQVKLEPGTTSETVEVSAASPAANVSGGAAQAVMSRNYSQMAEVRAKGIGSGAGYGSAGKDAAISEPPAQWTLSPSGSVERSIDAGKTWQDVFLSASVASGTVFRALSAVGTHVWAGGNGGMLFHSDDSGRSWVRLEVGADGQKLTGDITHVDFSDALNGTVSTAKGETWSTADGGQSWHRK